MELKEEFIVKNYAQFKRALSEYVGEEFTDKIIKEMGGENVVVYSTFLDKADTNLAYQGALVHNILRITAYATKINNILPEEQRVDKNSLVKVCILSHIARAVMFEENDNSWEINNRGMIYKYRETEGALRVGERSILMAMNCGVKFTPTEFEAMRIMDQKPDDIMSKMFSTTLSMVVRQANEMVYQIYKNG